MVLFLSNFFLEIIDKLIKNSQELVLWHDKRNVLKAMCYVLSDYQNESF